MEILPVVVRVKLEVQALLVLVEVHQVLVQAHQVPVHLLDDDLPVDNQFLHDDLPMEQKLQKIEIVGLPAI